MPGRDKAQRQETKAAAQLHHVRPDIERTLAQVATQGGRRVKLRYRATTKNNAWLKYPTAAPNLRNPIGRGLTRIDRTWALAT